MTDAAVSCASAPPVDTRSIAVVLNARAGALLSRADALDAATGVFAQAGLRPDFVPLDAGNLPRRVEIAREMNPGAVVVAGGDGSIGCAAQRLAGTDTPLGLVPFGTMNLLAKDLGIPTAEPEAAVRAIAAGHTSAIDVGEVNGHVFLNSSMIGLPAHVGRVREKQRARARGIRMWARVALAALRLMRRTRSRRFVIETDDGAQTVRATAMVVSVNAVDEPGGRALGRSSLEGGELVIYVFERLKVVDAARLAGRYLRGTWRDTAILREIHAASFTIRCGRKALRVMNDGENILLVPPLQFRLRPRALRVFSPAPPH
ncbi:MAG: hypothetical protein JO326_02915 [Acetobacteraceae bacterium]|nr:hypothetical protein [Acetobacteraceae bacterium]